MSVLDPPSQLPLEIHSASMRGAVEALIAAARSDAAIVLRAELGCEVSELARLAHQESARRAHRFLALSCSSLKRLPVQSLAATASGTLFLQEVGELAEPLQARLVHQVDALAARGGPPRLVSSTRSDLDEQVAHGCLRADLCFRLNVVDIRIPPLRERPDDILPAARTLIGSLSIDLGRRAPTLSAGAAEILQQHRFPGNLHELRNILERALLTSTGEIIDADTFAELRAADRQLLRIGEDVTLRDLESEHVTRVLRRVRSFKKAATILGVDASTLWRRRKRQEQPDTESRKSR